MEALTDTVTRVVATGPSGESLYAKRNIYRLLAEGKIDTQSWKDK